MKNQKIELDYVTQCLYYTTGEGEISGEVTVNDTHSPGGTRKAYVHSIVAWDMRGKKCVFEAWSKHSKNTRIYFSVLVGRLQFQWPFPCCCNYILKHGKGTLKRLRKTLFCGCSITLHSPFKKHCSPCRMAINRTIVNSSPNFSL